MERQIPGARARRASSRVSAALLSLVPLLLAVLLAPPLAADRRDQKAADLYHDGVELIRKGKYKEGAKKISEALQRGATEPNEQQGSETRYLERRYDPYYWLGVAQMELGLEEQALTNFEKSETFGVVKKWPEEFADLKKRRSALETKMAAAAPPTAIAPPSAPTATPAAVIAALPPTKPPVVVAAGPPPTETPISIRIVAARPTPTRAPEAPAEPPELALLRDARAELEVYAKDADLGALAGELLTPSLAELDRVTTKGTPAERRRAAENARAALEKAKPALLQASLKSALGALADSKWDVAARQVAAARRAEPKAPQPDLLDCALLATRFVLEGRKDALKIQSARIKLAEWRVKAGKPKDAMPSFLSPGLREALQ